MRIIMNVLSGMVFYCGFFFLLDLLAPSRFSFRCRGIAFAAIAAIIAATSAYLVDARYRFLLSEAVCLLFICVYSKASPSRYLLLFCLNTVILAIAEFVSHPILAAIGWDAEAFSPTSVWLPVANLALGAVYWIEVLLIRGAREAARDRVDRKTWLMIGACALFIVLCACYIMFRSSRLISYAERWGRFGVVLRLTASDGATLIVALALFALVIMFFSVINRMNKVLNDSQEAKRMAEQAKLALNQARVARESLENVASLRHDMKNHLLAVETLGRAGEWDRQRRYLDELRAGLEKEARA